MSAHQIRQQARQQWLRGKRQRHGPSFLAGEDDGTTDQLKNLAVFGYAARQFSRPKEPAGGKIDLIDLPLSDDSLMQVDRYDIRHLLLPSVVASQANSEPVRELPDPSTNKLRFATLEEIAISEKDLYYLDAEERRAAIEHLSRPKEDKPTETGHNIALQYDDDGNPIVAASHIDQGASGEDEPLALAFAVPDGMSIPESRRHFEIIESTAQFISSQPADMASRMEIVIQGRQASNHDFEFLHRASPLHAFYLHLRWLMQTGLYGYNSDSDSDSEADADTELTSALGTDRDPPDSKELHDSPVQLVAEDTDNAIAKAEPEESSTPIRLEVPGDVRMPAAHDTRAFIDRVACLVAKSPMPAKLEQKLRIEKATASSAYAFLSPFSELNRYYCFRRDCFISGLDAAVADAALADLGPSDADSDKQCRQKGQEQQDEASELCDVASVQAKRRKMAALFLARKKRQVQQDTMERPK
ncbi:hypothetical protein GGF44_003947 [Coemansia sp. RSA 1694]|nr:hypothetical protein GGF44_003947 [Coemansia sp. RSA 1694]